MSAQSTFPVEITELSPQKRHKDRFNLHLNGAFALGVHVDTVVEFGLHAGGLIDEQQYEAILQGELRSAAMQSALNLLAYRMRTEVELRRRLREKQYPDEVIEYTINRLREYRYLNDAEFAESWVRQQQGNRPKSKRAMAATLRQKGIAPDTVHDAVDQAEIDEAADALRISEKRWQQLRDLEPEVRKRRLVGFLNRRGYSFDLIRSTINQLEDRGNQGE